MTQPQPQPDNCIHGKLCTSLCDYLEGMHISAYPKCIDVRVMDCPHYCATHTPAAPATNKEWAILYPEVKEMCDACLKRNLDKARKAEREQVLDAFAKIIQQRYVGKYDNEAGDIPDVPVDELADIIQSLRGGAP